MDLVQNVAESTGVDRQTAESVLGTIFTSIRMATDAAVFGKVIEAWPDAERWMLGLPMGEGWTGEIVSLAGPVGLRRQLRMIGLEDSQITAAGATVGHALRDLLPPDAAEKVIKRLRLLE